MELRKLFRRYGLTGPQYAEFRDAFILERFQPGQVIFREGDPSDKVYFVTAGELTVYCADRNHPKAARKILGPGDLFGEMGIVHDTQRSATIEAITHVQLYSLDGGIFRELLEGNAAFRTFVDNVLVQRRIENIPLFERLDDDSLDQIRPLLEERYLLRGDVITQQGEMVDELFVLVEGSATMYGQIEGDDELSRRLEPGDNFGADSLFARRPCRVTVIADENCRILSLPGESFRRLLRNNPRIAFNIPGRGFFNVILPFLVNKTAYIAIPSLAMNRPQSVMRSSLWLTFFLLIMAALPSLWPQTFPFLNGLKVDTDPENMLAMDHPARIFHRQMKSTMTLHDMLVVGVVNQVHGQGVFNVASLAKVYELANFAKGLQWRDADDPERLRGVISVDLMAPSTVDVLQPEGPGTVRFAWLMPRPPPDEAAALAIRDTLYRFPTMDGTLISRDGSSLLLYLPLTAKDDSFRVYSELRGYIAKLQGDEQFFITGLPVAEDAFGVEMFQQMAISAPMAMLVIFLLMYYFFRSWTLILAPMIVALITVICTMSLLIISGGVVHIMSSMIPIFLMPIAVLDSIHILSEFFDRYPRISDRRLTLEHTMRELFVPMLYTSVTTAIGFLSLALVPIPPVQTFGIFVAVGVGLAWLLSISFVPAFVLLIPERRLANLAQVQEKQRSSGEKLDWLLAQMRKVATGHPHAVLMATTAVVVVCSVGLGRVQVNDNPVRWFEEQHPIRVADDQLNTHFAGTYMAFLALQSTVRMDDAAIAASIERLADRFPASKEQADGLLSLANDRSRGSALLGDLIEAVDDRLRKAADGQLDFLEAAAAELEGIEQSLAVFKSPEVLRYVSALQATLATTGIVGKSISAADIVKTVYRDLRGGSASDYRVPDSRNGIAQTYLTYQNGHRPQDLWRFVTPDYATASIWLLLNSGDNRDMSKVVQAVENYMAANPPPVDLSVGWFGLTYVNVVWQENMVTGMLYAVTGSFLTVLLLLSVLLRSGPWGVLAMAPLTGTLLLIFGLLGLLGRDFDMPVAVLSALTVGLAVDFSIHFLVRIRHLLSQTGNRDQAMELVYGEPARAIVRNIVVVAVGFLPLLAAPLVPYHTVGSLIATILLTSGIITLLVLAAVLVRWRHLFFPGFDPRRTTQYGPMDAYFTGAVGSLLVLVLFLSNTNLDWVLSYAPLVLAVMALPLGGLVFLPPVAKENGTALVKLTVAEPVQMNHGFIAV